MLGYQRGEAAGLTGMIGGLGDASGGGGQDDIIPNLGLDEIGGGGGGGGGRRSPRVPMPTHPSAGLGQPVAAPDSGSSSRSWDAPDESWEQPIPAPAPAPAAAVPAAPAAASDQPSSPAEWLKHYQDKQGMPDEAQGVIDSERKAAQTAGGSVTGKPYVPTLDEALNNPIN